MAKVFISYAHDDVGDFISYVELKLREDDFEYWRDNDGIRGGDDWPLKIDDALRESFALLLIKTPKAIQSQYVTYEWIFALGRGIKVIPLLAVPVDEAEVHPRLHRIQHIDCTDSRHKFRPWHEVVDQLKKAQSEYNSNVPLPKLSTNTPLFIENIMKDLADTKKHVRRQAIDTLAESKDPLALEALCQLATEYPLPEVQIYAAFKFADKTEYQDQLVIVGLLEALRSRDDDDRKKAANRLKRYGEAAVPGILQALEDSFSETRYIAAVAIGELKEKSALPILITLLDDEHTKVAYAALAAIAAIGDMSVIPALRDKLARSDEHMQLRVAEVLIKFGDYSIQDHLLKLLKSTNSDSIARPIEELLFQIPNVNIIEVITIMQEARNPIVRAIAAEILGIMKSDLAIPYLIDALDDKEQYVYVHAQVALENIGTQAATLALTNWREKKHRSNPT